MSDRLEFYVPGQPFDGGTYHYVESGLSNVYLLNGFTIEDDPDYGRLVTFNDQDTLHKAIGVGIIENGKPLTGREFKFLRGTMGMTQAAVAKRFGVDAQTIANYEKGSNIPKPTDVMFKSMFLLYVLPEDVRASVIKELIEAKAKRSKAVEQERDRAIRTWRESEHAGQEHVFA